MIRAVPVREAPRFPATAGLAVLAVGVTVLSWSGYEVGALSMSYRAYEGEPWRLVSAALPHVGVAHLAFNVYWLWVFGARLEARYGALRTLALYALCAVVANAAEHAVFAGGVGLSGVGYGLAGYLAVAAPRDPLLADAIDRRTLVLFALWFVFCVVATITRVMPVANVAHGAGALVGVSVAAAVTRPLRWAWAIGTVLLALAALAGSSFARPLVNLGRGGSKAAIDAEAAFARGDYEEAERLYRYAASVDPEEARHWYNVGVSQRRHGESGLQAHVRAHALAPDDERYSEVLAAEHRRLAREADEREDSEGAIAHRRAVVEVEPEAESYYRLCVALLHAEQEALEPCARAHELAPDDVSFAHSLAGAHRHIASDAWAREDWRRAVEHYGRARDLTDGAIDHVNAALASERLGDRDAARRGYELALQRDPSSEPAARGLLRLTTPSDRE